MPPLASIWIATTILSGAPLPSFQKNERLITFDNEVIRTGAGRKADKISFLYRDSKWTDSSYTVAGENIGPFFVDRMIVAVRSRKARLDRADIHAHICSGRTRDCRFPR